MNNQNIFTVSDLNNQIKNIIESGFSNILVEGEISQLTKHASGHMYFNIKDNSSTLGCVMFNYQNSLNNYNPQIGDKVKLSGKASLWVKGGAFKFHVNTISLSGEGDLWAKFEALKKKLLQEGLFDSSYKKEIPKYPKKIALITSLNGSVIKDIIDVVDRNSPYLKLVVRDCRMQGEEAVQDLVNALDDIHLSNLEIDTIIIARGGGSLEDLWCFNSEALAYKIFNSKIPIISAIGHETDTTISDLVADKRAGTPSIAAEIVAPSVTDCLQDVAYFQDKILEIIKNKIEKHFIELKSVNQRHGLHKAKYVLSNHKDRFLRIENSLSFSNLSKYTKLKKDKIGELYNIINTKIEYNLKAMRDKVNYLDNYSRSFNPKDVMKRGYSVIYNKDGKIVTKSENIRNKDELDIKLYNGKLKVEVLKSNKDKEK